MLLRLPHLPLHELEEQTQHVLAHRLVSNAHAKQLLLVAQQSRAAVRVRDAAGRAATHATDTSSGGRHIVGAAADVAFGVPDDGLAQGAALCCHAALMACGAHSVSDVVTLVRGAPTVSEIQRRSSRR
jgi:hypothetical protein